MTSRQPLTQGERRVIGLVAAGCTNAQIGRHLGLSTEAVKSRVGRVLRKLRAVNRAHAVGLAAGLDPVASASAGVERVAVGDVRRLVDRWDGRAPKLLLADLLGLVTEWPADDHSPHEIRRNPGREAA